MSFLEAPAFPACPSFGYSFSPGYSVRIVQMESGRELRNRNWARPLIRVSCTVGPREEEEIYSLLGFWHAVGGTECGFRFRNPADCLSCAIGQTPAATDQPLVSTGDSPAAYQLTKRYTRGARSQDIDIVKPVPGTVIVANQLGELQPPTAYTLDTTTGVLVPNGGFVGVPATWGGEFDLPMRFDSEFPIEIIDQRIQSVTFTLVELRNP